MQEPQGATRAPRIPADLEGFTVGRFVIEGRLGSGGMGQVYRAQDSTLKRTVAIKRMTPHHAPDDLDRHRFLNEAQRASALNHPNIAAVHDVIEFEGELFLVMEFVDGATLRQRFHGRPFETPEFLDIALQCAEGLAAAHEQGIVHGDIKPENIMLTPSGRVKILDFGVARRFAAGATEATQTLLTTTAASGTPAYMAPEVLRGQSHDGRADLFSLGLVFYEMLGGHQPFAAETFAATAGRVLHVEPMPLSEVNASVPSPVAETITRLIKKDPDHRTPSSGALASELRAIQTGHTQPLPSLVTTGSAARFALHSRTLGAALALILVLALTWAFSHFRIPVRTSQGPPAATQPSVRILAILPVTAADADPQLSALSRGLVQSVAAKLGKFSEERSLEVIPASNMQDKGIATLDDARKQFGATLGLTVDLRESSGMVRVAYSLLDALSGRVLSGDSVTVPSNDIFALEDSVAQGTIFALKLDLTPDEQTALKVRGTTVPAAYNHYLQSRGYLLNWTAPENVDNAILLLKDAIKLDPNFGAATAALGEAYWRKYWHTKQANWTKLARTECDRAVSLGNAGSAGPFCLGVISDGSGDYEKAVAEYRMASQLDPRNESAALGLALALEHQGKMNLASQTYEGVIATHPQSWTAVNSVGTFYYRQKDFPKAIEFFQKVTQLAPEGYAGFVNLGAVYNNSGEYQKAIDALKRSLQLRPTYAANVNLGNAYFYLLDFSSAARYYEEATKLNPRQYVTWGNLGEAHYYAHQLDKAVLAYRKAIDLANEELKVNPRDADVLGSLAGYHSMLGHRKEALTLLERTLQYQPNDKDTFLLAAEIHNQFGETGVALEWLSKSIQAGYSRDKLAKSPVFANLAANPRFQQLMRTDNK